LIKKIARPKWFSHIPTKKRNKTVVITKFHEKIFPSKIRLFFISLSWICANYFTYNELYFPSSKSAMCPNGILAVGCIPIGSVVILVMGHYYKFLSKHSSNPNTSSSRTIRSKSCNKDKRFNKKSKDRWLYIHLEKWALFKTDI
jgi:hypothetical protein